LAVFSYCCRRSTIATAHTLPPHPGRHIPGRRTAAISELA
jgi:hypothetical protein